MNGPRERINLWIGVSRHRSRDEILSLSERLPQFQRQRSELDRLLTPSGVADLADVCDTSRCGPTIELLTNPKSPRHLIVTSYIGHPLIVLLRGAQLGIPFALLYETLSEDYAQALHCLGVRLISVERRKSAVHSYLVAIETALKEGLHLATVFDSPHERGVRVDFLGHEVRVAYFYAMLSYEHGLPLVPIYSWLTNTGIVIEPCEPIQCDRTSPLKQWATSLASDLFSHLEALVLQHPEQYRWDESSVIASIPDYLMRAAEALALSK